MDAARKIIHWPLFNPVGVTVLYGSMTIHGGLAFYALYQRRRLKMRFGAAVQLVFGLSLPLLLIDHMLGTRAAFSFLDTQVNYIYVLLAQWRFDPLIGIRQILVLSAAWVHGCIGMYYWLRLKPAYKQWEPFLFGVAVLIPALSFAGFIRGSRDALALAADPVWLAAFQTKIQWPDAAEIRLLHQIESWFFIVFFSMLTGVLALRWARTIWEKRRGVVELTYDDGRTTWHPPGGAILDLSRAAGIPHASVCGGRGRCSTCRVRVTRGAENLPPPDASEQKVLARVKAGPQVRLACQARPRSGTIDIIRLLPPTADAKDGFSQPDYIQGKELDVTVLFADIRAFTELSEDKLPYDVVFMLNRYFECVGAAITESGGYLDKFIGDGVMAIFGINDGPEAGSRAAVRAARNMFERLEGLNRLMQSDLESPIRIGVGLHHGPAIVGQMGYGDAIGITAIGDTVNTASRLESMTKDFKAQLVISESVAKAAKLDLSAFSQRDADIRGRTGVITVHAIADALELKKGELESEVLTDQS